ncbi:hypothetical protein, partial [Parafrankia sp. EUN1f]
VVGGGEEIRLLLGGTDDPEVYVAVESDADGQELARVGVGTSHETYEEVVLDLPGHSGKTVRLRLVDNSTTGHLNVDDVRNLTDGAVNSSFDGGSGTSAHDRGSVDNIAYVIDHAAGQRSTETSTRPCESSTGGAPQSTTL